MAKKDINIDKENDEGIIVHVMDEVVKPNVFAYRPKGDKQKIVEQDPESFKDVLFID